MIEIELMLPTIKVSLGSSTTLERTFSIFKRLKSYLRSIITEERFNGLTISNINKREELIEFEVLQSFSKTSTKRL
jgi:hypothetical protein